MSKADRPDIETEIITGKLLAIVDEMAVVMARTSKSPVIYEVLDFACGVCDRDGALIAQTNGIALFTGTFSAQVRFILQRFGQDLRPGDSFLSNDPFVGGTHTCDMAVIRPIFHGGALIAFAIVVAHWLDVGGAVPGSLSPDATSVFQEGIRLSGVRITRDDRLLDDMVRVIAENVRLPDLALGDLNAEIAAVHIADRRLGEVIGKYGVPMLQRVFADILTSSERQARQVVAGLPDGRYPATDWIDGDGVTEERIPVQVTVTVEGDQMEVHFTGSAPARNAPINCAVGALESAVKTEFKALVGPQQPSNDGWFRPLRIKVPRGTVFSAEKPMPTGWYYEGSAQASELVWRALAPLAPERFSAGSYMSWSATYFTGEGQNGEFVHIEPQHGGWGATPTRDGTSGLIAITDGDTYNYSIEVLEAKFPLLVRRYGLNVEAGSGAGRFRGGFGLVREYEIKALLVDLYASFGRSVTRPWGMDGGGPGGTNQIQVEGRNGKARLTRTPRYPLGAGDRVRIVTGGGWGLAKQRNPSAVADDVADGLLTTAEAAETYGVVLDAATGAVDAAATERQRGRMA